MATTSAFHAPCLATTANPRNTASLEAARKVLTSDVRPDEAVWAICANPQAATKVLRKIRNAMEADGSSAASHQVMRLRPLFCRPCSFEPLPAAAEPRECLVGLCSPARPMAQGHD